MKTCFKCNKEKPIDEFYKHPQMADGHLGKCKECNKKDTMDRYNELIQDPNWHLKERARCREKFHRLYSDGRYRNTPEENKKKNKKYAEQHPEKDIAKKTTSNAMRDGKLVRQPCEICGETKVQAHHEDYSKPLEVRWLCVKHHNDRHVELREIELLQSKSK